MVEDENYDEDCSEYEIDRDEGEEGHYSVKDGLGNQTNISIPQTPHYQKLVSQNWKNVKSPVEKITNVTEVDEDTDSDSFDPVGDEDITSYDPLGDIVPTTRRIVVKGAKKTLFWYVSIIKI